MQAQYAHAPDYAHIFDQRADGYHAAMRLMPQARRAEFTTLFSEIPLQAHDSMLDIPSGGGYLQHYLDTPCAIQCFDFSAGFAHEGGAHVQKIDAHAPFWPIGVASRVVSLAGLHHFDDPLAAVARLLRHVQPGGVLHVADVAQDSPQGAFLNGFVDRYNPQGHKGNFFPTARSAWPADWRISRLRQENIPWVFADVQAMCWFCCNLFGVPLQHAAALQAELARLPGYTEYADRCELHWSLLYLDVHAPA
ncbi:methyltransferase domain-containing protein [Massilia sp. W12]|uniref:class I SAM-dependent methyltransferase n=1 Tax=Massilia sp. W12 TaxID=3126507 RepID=UPI0030D5284A